MQLRKLILVTDWFLVKLSANAFAPSTAILL